MRIAFSFMGIICLGFFSINLNAQVKVVGSSTVYPFSTIIAERFHDKNPRFETPIIESTGTGGGFKSFCDNAGVNSPDMNNASREIKETEIATCRDNGIQNITKITLGYDSIILIHPQVLGKVNFTIEQLYLALATSVPSSTGTLIPNPYKKWSDIDKSLPNIPIKVLGPASTSGTKDTFVELALEKSCRSLYSKGKLNIARSELDKACKSIRSDGAWINGGENDVLLIKKVSVSKDMFAILGYNYYEQSKRLVSATAINGIEPTEKALKNKSYPFFRPLFVYVKTDNIGVVKGLKEFIAEMVSKEAIGSNGYLKSRGLIPLTKAEYKVMISNLKLK